ncbi:hypothetical protein EBB07_33700 [Paenibacillaceae bacterium]|nr:hypothetical protein EBB07_33700 [Paenibacillaceae bacterium]
MTKTIPELHHFRRVEFGNEGKAATIIRKAGAEGTYREEYAGVAKENAFPGVFEITSGCLCHPERPLEREVVLIAWCNQEKCLLVYDVTERFDNLLSQV